MDSLRLEKSYKLVGRELSIEYAALESGLERFVDFDKGAFLGRDALVTWRGKGFENRSSRSRSHGVDRRRRARLRAGDEGSARRSAARPRAAMAGGPASRWRWRWLRPEFAAPGTEVEIHVLGEARRASSSPTAHTIPRNEALRA